MVTSVVGRMFGRDIGGQIRPQDIPMLIGIIIVVLGLGIVGTHLGNGLIWIGAGLAIAGYSGFATLHYRMLAISGTGGIVLIILGALIKHFWPTA